MDFIDLRGCLCWCEYKDFRISEGSRYARSELRGGVRFSGFCYFKDVDLCRSFGLLCFKRPNFTVFRYVWAIEPWGGEVFGVRGFSLFLFCLYLDGCVVCGTRFRLSWGCSGMCGVESEVWRGVGIRGFRYFWFESPGVLVSQATEFSDFSGFSVCVGLVERLPVGEVFSLF